MTSSLILGLNAAGFNTSSALLVDGTPVFAAEEERLIREKRTRKFPTAGIRSALAWAGASIEDVDTVAVGWNPAINLEAFNQPQSLRARYLGEILYSVPNNLMAQTPGRNATVASQEISFADRPDLSIVYVTHHQAHAASFFCSPFEDAAVLTVDAFGEKHCVMVNDGRGNTLTPLWNQEFPHSLGSFYSAMTEYLGFAAQSDEWKVMGAGAYGDAKSPYYGKLRSLIDLHEDGGFELDLSYFNHYQFHRPGLTTPKMTELLGLPPRSEDDSIGDSHYDLAAAAQQVFEDIYFHLVRGAHRRSGSRNLVLAGGSTLNSLANGKILEQAPFDDLFIPPAPDDGGTSLGAAQYVWHQLKRMPRDYVMRSNYLGPEHSDEDIAKSLGKWKIGFRRVEDPAKTAAEMIAKGGIIGWFQGRLEFGDRALGNRSILADPRDARMKELVNDTVKYREPFRPFAPSVLAERVDDYFEGAVATPFMEKVCPIRHDKRSIIPAVTHADGTGRLHTVTREQNPKYYRLIEHLDELTGVPIVLNTSFNLKGEAMVCSIDDAVRTFYSSGLDALVAGNCVVHKRNPT